MTKETAASAAIRAVMPMSGPSGAPPWLAKSRAFLRRMRCPIPGYQEGWVPLMTGEDMASVDPRGAAGASAFEPERLYCTAGDCLDEALVVGYATFEVSPSVRALDCERRHTFALPLCHQHADLLRMDNTLVEFDSGARSRDSA
jgi:hypothetical protein